jgi:uracil-DNA glycosylase
MGDAAIKAINGINKRLNSERVIPAGSTYKIRGGHYKFLKQLVFPSCLQVSPKFGI